MTNLKKKFSDVAKPLEGKVIAFTGEMTAVTRKQASAIAHELGATVSRTVSAATDFVVAGKNAGQRLQRAANKGVKIVTETEFFEKVREQRRINKTQKPG